MPTTAEHEQATVPWTLKGFGLVDNRRVDPRLRSEGHYPHKGTFEVKLVSDDPALTAFFAGVDRIEEGALAQLEECRSDFTRSEPYKKVVNLRKSLAEAMARQQDADNRAQAALAQAAEALGRGKDPTASEQVARDARIDGEVFANRAAACKKLLVDAETEAQAILREQLEARRGELATMAQERLTHLEGRFRETIQEQLAPLVEAKRRLAALAVNDHRRAPNGGPLPNPIEPFCDLP
jgi:hypothetical protein